MTNVIWGNDETWFCCYHITTILVKLASIKSLDNLLLHCHFTSMFTALFLYSDAFSSPIFISITFCYLEHMILCVSTGTHKILKFAHIVLKFFT